MKSLILALYLAAPHQIATPDTQHFCRAWSNDARQAIEKRDMGLSSEQLESFIASVPGLDPRIKARVISAVRWAYGSIGLTQENIIKISYEYCIEWHDNNPYEPPEIFI